MPLREKSALADACAHQADYEEYQIMFSDTANSFVSAAFSQSE